MSTESMSDKPLHVAVAEAVGWTNCHPRKDGMWLGDKPISGPSEISTCGLVCADQEIPRYDLSWCATGPLIERLGVSLDECAPVIPPWAAWLEGSKGEDWTPTLAVCRLILTLHKEGKLKV